MRACVGVWFVDLTCSRTSTRPAVPHCSLSWPNWDGVTVIGPETPFGLSGISCFTGLHVLVSIRKLFLLAWRLTWVNVSTVLFTLRVFVTVVRNRPSGWGWLLTGGAVVAAARSM